MPRKGRGKPSGADANDHPFGGEAQMRVDRGKGGNETERIPGMERQKNTNGVSGEREEECSRGAETARGRKERSKTSGGKELVGEEKEKGEPRPYF